MQPIEIQNVTKDFGQGRGVFDVSFSVKEGEVFGYLGPNGAGKSTTIRQLLGFVKPQKGSLQILGMDCFRKAAQIHKHIGYLAGEIAFVENMKGMEYIEFIARLRGMKDDARIKELIEMFELNPSGKIRKMSKGMKQKIALVTAFMDSPKVVILDEPTSGLDPLMQNRFVDLILEEKKKGTTILMSSHIFEEVERTCDRTAIIRQGKIVDTVDMTEEGMSINGYLQQEIGIYEETLPYTEGIRYPVTVGKGEVFVLGDRREQAVDSRIYGTVQTKDTCGCVMTVIRQRGI